MIDAPNAYYENGQYLFFMYNEQDDLMEDPIRLAFTAEDKGPAWGVKVVSGDGSQGNPFTFALIMNKPYDITFESIVGGTYETNYTKAEPGEKATFKVYPGSGYEFDIATVKTVTSGTEVTVTGEGEDTVLRCRKILYRKEKNS